MAEMIEEYLGRLRAELAGEDPALAQDALYDAEEYLRDELASRSDEDPATAFAAIVEEYGSPHEIAVAYMEAELQVAKALRTPMPREGRSPMARFFGVLWDPRSYAALFYLFLSFVTGILYFTVVSLGISLSVGLSILIIGVPIMLLFLAIVRAISFAEGRVVEAMLGERMPRRPRSILRGGNLLERIKAWLTDLRTWTTMLYMALQLPIGIIYFTLMVVMISLSGSLVVAPIAQLFTGEPYIWADGYGYMFQPWAVNPISTEA